MPELPDIVAYADSLRSRLLGASLKSVRMMSPFVLRTYEPAINSLEGRTIRNLGRLGKQFVFDFGDERYAVIHLMIAGRFRWIETKNAKPGKIALAQFHFDRGTLVLTEAAQKKRASIHVVNGKDVLRAFNASGLELLSRDDTHVFPVEESAPASATLDDFAARLRTGNHALKRALTDPRNFSGIGNAYADEILHAARLSPILWTSRATAAELQRLFAACVSTLASAVDRLRAKFRDKFPGPGEITAFRPEFAVHGKFGRPCSICGSKVQRIRYAENETNYCPTCQTDGKILADRSLSRLLRDDWPRSVEELESPGLRGSESNS